MITQQGAFHAMLVDPFFWLDALVAPYVSFMKCP
jgi:hypothetical protein